MTSSRADGPIVDNGVCVGTGTCSQIASRVFVVDDGVARVVAVPADDAEWELVHEAVDSCPVEALHLPQPPAPS